MTTLSLDVIDGLIQDTSKLQTTPERLRALCALGELRRQAYADIRREECQMQWAFAKLTDPLREDVKQPSALRRFLANFSFTTSPH